MGTTVSKQSTASERRRRNKSNLVKKALQSIEEKLTSNELKASVGDFIRLLQMEEELEAEEPREIRVTWVEQKPTESVTEG